MSGDYTQDDLAGTGYYKVTYYVHDVAGPFATVAEMARGLGLSGYPADGYVLFVDESGNVSSVPSLNPDDLVDPAEAYWYVAERAVRAALPEHCTAQCAFCYSVIVLDVSEGGGDPANSNAWDWGMPFHPGEVTFLDYGCPASPETNDDGTGGHSPLLHTIAGPA